MASALVYGIGDGLVLFLIAYSFSLTFQLGLFRIDLAIALFLGAALPYWVASTAPCLLVPAAVSTAILCAVLVAGLERFLFCPIARLGGGQTEQMLASMGVYYFLLAPLHHAFGGDPLVFGIRDRVSQSDILLFSLVPVLAIIISARFLSRTRDAYAAVRLDPMLAELSGISRDRVVLLASAVGGFLSSNAGSLLAVDRGLALYTPLLLFTKAIAIVLLVRANRVLDLLIGSLVIGVMQYALGIFAGEIWRQLLVYVLLIIVLALSAAGARFPYFRLSRRDWPI